MKLTDFLQDVGRPVAYYPALRRVTGSTNATILLCQFIYWRGKEASGDGWLYKTAEEIETETGLSYGEQKTARRDLVSAGLLEEHYARLDHQMRFKLDLDALNTKWGIVETVIPESDKPQLGNDEKPLSLSSNTEITTENTTKLDILDGILQAERTAQAIDAALEAFQVALKTPLNWCWYPAKSSDEPAWRELREFVVKTWQVDNRAFEKYAEWRSTPYVKGAMSNLAIKRAPAEFETSYSDFLAWSSMYGDKPADQPAPRKIYRAEDDPDRKKEFVPAPPRHK